MCKSKAYAAYCQQQNATFYMTHNIIEILELAIEKAGSQAELCRRTKLTKSTLWRIMKGKTFRTQGETIARLLRVINSNG